jgi:hypothetical protein
MTDNVSETDVSLFKHLFAIDTDNDKGLSKNSIIEGSLGQPHLLKPISEVGDEKLGLPEEMDEEDEIEIPEQDEPVQPITGEELDEPDVMSNLSHGGDITPSVQSQEDRPSPNKTQGEERGSIFHKKLYSEADPGLQRPVSTGFTEADLRNENNSPDTRREKQEILFNLMRTYPNESNGQWNMKVPLYELRYELMRREKHTEEQEQIFFMKQMMKLILRGIEVANKKFGPFLELDGWSESVTQDMHRYDRALKALYHRYFKRKQSNPIMDLLWLIGGSMLMFHLKNKFIGKRSKQKNPMWHSNADDIQNAHDIQPPRANFTREPETEETRSGGIDIGSLLKLFGSKM